MISEHIFVSSSCVNNNRIGDSVLQLAQAGYKNIELSGGTNLYDDWKSDLIRLMREFGLRYRCHNYFPPPSEHFVLNLSASNDNIRKRSMEHVEAAINLSRDLGATEYGIHAGFRFLPDHKKLGKKFTASPLDSEDAAIERFASAWCVLKSYAENQGIKLYVENNVFSKANRISFGANNPFLATDSGSIEKLAQACNVHLLLDVAHLKVSCATLGLCFEKELSALMPKTDYLHFSDNNGTADTNQGIKIGSPLYQQLRKFDLQNKTITLEVYDDSLAHSMESVKSLIG
ncbi:sugar phosphate isomerase/epimerase family protein [Alteromonas gracilis]|uniref:sugar phosphate isomerase/epimerase family protein n=1 Tax=Alteromonas gracilis TaxID=1479524 RepID=UPI003736050A